MVDIRNNIILAILRWQQMKLRMAFGFPNINQLFYSSFSKAIVNHPPFYHT